MLVIRGDVVCRVGGIMAEVVTIVSVVGEEGGGPGDAR